MDNLKDENSEIYEEYLKSKDKPAPSYVHVGSPEVFLAFIEARAVYDFSNNKINIHGYPEGTIEHSVYLNKIGELIEKGNNPKGDS